MIKLTVKENLSPLKELARKARELDGRQQNMPLLHCGDRGLLQTRISTIDGKTGFLLSA